MNQNNLKNVSPQEMTLRAIVLGVVIGVLFGAANAYLGLKVGLTVSASVPAAVMAVTIFGVLKRSGITGKADILENNMVQTIGSAGESLAAGVIFTVPALILLGFDPDVLKIFILGAIGGLLGVFFMIPLREYLIVKEHGNLTYPEGTACASVLVAGDEGGKKGKLVFFGLGIGAFFELLISGAGIFKSAPKWEVPNFPAAEVSADSSPALLGVGYVIGPKIAAIMFGGGALSWLVFIPAIKLFAGQSDVIIYPAPSPVSELGAHDIWHYYMRYIGAGAVAFGGVVTLIRSLPVIVSSVGAVFSNILKAKENKDQESDKRTGRDLSGKVMLGGIIILFLAMALLPRDMVPGNFVTSIIAVVFAFFFVAVSSRVVGLIGSSSNPVSGMTIAALLATTLLFKLLGWTSEIHQAAALSVGAIICISAAIAGDASQDLKTGYLVGATPRLQQIGEVVGVLTSAAFIGVVVLRLHSAYGIGSDALPAPQATLMSLVVKGVLSGDLPWTLVFIGISVAAVIEIIGIPSLPFAVGLYLPLSLTTPILLGGGIRAASEFKSGRKQKEKQDEKNIVGEKGVLFASGLIAGSAFIGMTIGLLRSINTNEALNLCVDNSNFAECILKYPYGSFTEFFRLLPDWIHIGPEWAGGGQNAVSCAALLVLSAVLYFMSRSKDEIKS
jgi:putative OPT family oligopeptide transporter